MHNQDDREYYLRRAQEELDFGDAARDAAVSAIHYELATRYALLTDDRTARNPHMALVEGGRFSTCSPAGPSSDTTAQERVA